jgi:hypothetical protein
MRFFFAICFALFATIAHAENCTLNGTSVFCDNGLSGNRSGNTTFWSDGTSSTRPGDSTFNSDGSSAIHSGGSTFYSDGTSAIRSGKSRSLAMVAPARNPGMLFSATEGRAAARPDSLVR